MRVYGERILMKFLLVMFLITLIGPVLANTIGTVRYLEVIAAHPRMLKFDFDAHRFSDGPSAQISLKELQEKGQLLAARLQELNSSSAAGIAGLEKKLSVSATKKSKAETDFWAEKEKLDNEIEAVRNEIAANIAAMEFGGRTIETTILPELSQIIADVSAAVTNAAAARNCTMVLNETLPVTLITETDNWIEEGYSSHFRSGNSSDDSVLKRWVSYAGRIVPRLSAGANLLKPVITGSVDLTADAIKLLTQPARKGGVSKK
ncbi:MAG: hypothetical protein A2W80_06745 [Candidatus Riflebacteria bacterium GWC2_50_8]|nr:MAG: hypothetical protein A2W80_06745 [Candidatus Riflebacteria bacterium GWC2_50_8]